MPFLGVMFGAFLALAALQAYLVRRAGFHFSRRPPTVPAHIFGADQSESFRGAARIGWINTSLPLARVRLDRKFAEISGFRAVRIERDQVNAVRRTPLLLGSGVRFDSTDGRYDGVVFWPLRPRAVLDAFNRFGWP